MNETTYTEETNQEPITIESLIDIWENQKIIPMTWKPTGETVYVTLKVAAFIQRFTEWNDRLDRKSQLWGQ